MTPAEHRAEAERLLDLAAQAYRDEEDDAGAACERRAQVHATLALTPQQQPVQSQHGWDLSKPAHFPDALGDVLTVGPTAGNTGVIGSYGTPVTAAWLIEDPATLRALASVLTAHADRMEKP